MRKILVAILFIAVFASCKKGEIIKGDFIYYEGAAVVQTDSTIYGVVIDKKALKLDEQAQQYKKETTDMVSVEIRGKIIPLPDGEEGWPFSIKINEIISVSEAKPEDNEVLNLGKE